MQAVLAVIVAFVFVCTVVPGLVKNRQQYNGALIATLLAVFLESIAVMFGYRSLGVFAAGLSGFLQLGAILLLVVSTGGLTIQQLTGEVADTYQVLRRGQETPETIIPPPPVASPATPVAPPAPERKPQDLSSIPVE